MHGVDTRCVHVPPRTALAKVDARSIAQCQCWRSSLGNSGIPIDVIQIAMMESDTNREIWRDEEVPSADNESAAVKRWEGEGGALGYYLIVTTENSAELVGASALKTLHHPRTARQ